MPDFLKSILSSGLVRARVQKILRGASMAAGAWALTSTYVFITTRFPGVDHADAMSLAGVVSGAVGGIILSGGSLAYSMIDAKTVDAKVETAAATGSVAAANSPEVRAQVTAASGSPEALKQVLATLAAGNE